MKTQTVKWYQSLNFQGALGLLSITLWLIFGVVIVMNTRGKQLVLDESSRLIEQIGNNAVSDLNSRSLEIAALARTLATTAEHLPKSEETFKRILPEIINFQGDLKVAGGGFWPERYAFSPKLEKRSFFWGRDAKGNLKYYDDYNQSVTGYHQEEWYVPTRYVQPGRCFWSKSYMDPYSYQPMVTCSVASFEKGKFSGVATIDLKLEGLQSFVQSWQEKTGGYIFILDRNNKFIAFPDLSLVKRIGKDSKGNKTEEFILASELAEKYPLFLPIAKAVDRINQNILAAEQKKPNFTPKIAEEIDRDSYQIDRQEAEFVNAIILDTLNLENASKLYNKFEINNDFLLKEASKVFIFHVPGSYWKLVIVQPVSKATLVASYIIQLLIIYIAITVVVIIGLAYFILNRFIIKPLIKTATSIESLGVLVADKKYTELKDCQIEYKVQNEIGLVAKVFNTLTSNLTEVTKALQNLQRTQTQLIQSEKMSSLGQMVAGVAHEINNPVNFIHGNIDYITQYSQSLLNLLELYQKYYPEPAGEISAEIEAIDLPFIVEDLPKTLSSMKIGAVRIRGIVLSLRNFSRLDEAEMKAVDIHEGIDSTLLILQNRIKTKSEHSEIKIIKEYGALPTVECYAGQLNQVFMNILANAIDALDEYKQQQVEQGIKSNPSTIQISTELVNEAFVRIKIADNGSGIPPQIKQQIFDPFFTTKTIGKGTGLGLSISYDIVVEKHGGVLRCESEVGRGTEFYIEIPVKQSSRITTTSVAG